MINILEYTYGSNKGSAKRGEVFSSPLAYQGMNQEYSSSSVTEVVAGSSGSKVTPQWGPFIKGYNLTQGVALTLDTDGTVSPVADGDTIAYTYNNENVPVEAPEIAMNIRSLPITTTSRKLKAVWSFDAQWELTKEYGKDIHELLATQAVAEIEQEIDNEITTDLYRIANAGPEITWSRMLPTGVNQMDHYDSFYARLVEGSNQIFAATRRAHANFLVCGMNVSSVLKCMRNFSDSEDSAAIGPHFIGTIGAIKCYVNPNYDPDTFVMGYKGPNLIDAGYVYAPYLPVTTIGMLSLADDFASREGWGCMYGKKAINPRLYIKGRIY